MHRLLFLVAFVLIAFGAVSAVQAVPNWNMVSKTQGKSGTEMPGGISRVSLARNDLHARSKDFDTINWHMTVSIAVGEPIGKWK